MAFSPITGAVVGFSSNQTNAESAKLIAGTNPGTICFTEDGNLVVGGNIYSAYLITGMSSVNVQTLTSWDDKSVWLTTDGKIMAIGTTNKPETFADLTANTTGSLSDYTNFDELSDNAKFVDALNNALSKAVSAAGRITVVENKTNGIVYCESMTLDVPMIGGYTTGKVELGSNDQAHYNVVRTYTSSTTYTNTSCEVGKIYNVSGIYYIFDGTTCKKLKVGGSTLILQANGSTLNTYDGTADKTFNITAESLGISSAFTLKGTCVGKELTPSYFESKDDINVGVGQFACVDNTLYIMETGGVEDITGKNLYTIYMPTFAVTSEYTGYGIVRFKNKDGEELIQAIYKITDGSVDITFTPESGWVFTDEDTNCEWYYNSGKWLKYGDEGSYALKATTYTKAEVNKKLPADAEDASSGGVQVLDGNAENLFVIPPADQSASGVMTPTMVNTLSSCSSTCTTLTNQLKWE